MRCIKNYALATNYRNKSKYPYRSNVVIPTIFSNIHDQLPRIEAAIFGGEPMVTAFPINQIAIDNTQNVEDMWTWDFMRAGIRQKTVSWVLQYLIFGDAFLKPFYRFDIDKVSGKIIYDGPDAAIMDWWSAYFDPAATSTQPPDYWIHRKIYTSKKRFLKDAQLYGYKNADKVGAFGVSGEDYRQDVLNYINLGYNNADALKDAVEVLEFHDTVERTFTVVANRETILKETTPELFEGSQYIKISNYEQPMQFYSKGEPEIMESMFHALNNKFNQGIDAAEIFNNQSLVVESDTLENDSQNILRPGSMIRVKKGRAEGIKEAPFRNVTLPGNLQEQQQLMVYMRMATVGEHALSAPSQKKTATETDYIANKETGRLDLKISLIEYLGVKEYARVSLDMRKKMLGMGMVIVKSDEMTGKKYPWVLKEQDLEGEFDPQPMGSRASASRDKEREEATAVLNEIKGVPFINQREAFKDFLNAMGRKDIGRFFDLAEAGNMPTPQIPGQPQLPIPEAVATTVNTRNNMAG